MMTDMAAMGDGDYANGKDDGLSTRRRESRFTDRSRSRSRSRSHSRERGERRTSRGERPRSKRIYMCNLPYNLNWMDIKDMVKKEVGDAFVELYEQNGKSTGCCVAQFRTLDMAEKCIDKLDRFTLGGRKIVVREEKEGDRTRHASHKTQQDRGPLGNNMGGGMGGGMSGGMGGGMGGGGMGGGGMGGGGMGGGMSGGMGGGMSGGMGGGMSGGMGGGMGPSMSGGMSGGMGGGMGGGGMGGGMGPSMGSMSMGGMGGGMGNMDRMGPSPSMNRSTSYNTHGIDQKVLDELGIEGPIVGQVFVANLDYKVTSPKLEEVFKLAGKVCKVEIRTDNDGKSKGFGSVTFESPFEAVQAISMLHNQILYDRTMSVRMDKMADDKPSLPSGLKTLGKGLDALKQNLSMNSMSDISKSPLMSTSSMLPSQMLSGSGGMSGMDSSLMGMGMGMGGSSSSGMGGMSGIGNTGLMGNMPSSMPMMNNSMSGLNPSLGSNMSGSLMGMGNNLSGMGQGLGMSEMGSMNNMGGMSGMGMSSLSGSGMNSMMGSRGLDSAVYTGIDSSGRANVSANVRSTGASNLNNADRGFDDTVAVKNLDYNVSWQEVKDHFRSIGLDVKYARIKVENGKSTGQAVVRFASANEAKIAIEKMNGTDFKGRNLVVRLDRGERN